MNKICFQFKHKTCLVTVIKQDFEPFNQIFHFRVSNILDYFEPNFSDTQSYKSIRDFADTSIVVIQYLNKFLEKQRKDSSVNYTDIALSKTSGNANVKSTVESVSNIFSNAMEVFEELADNGTSMDMFNMYVLH